MDIHWKGNSHQKFNMDYKCIHHCQYILLQPKKYVGLKHKLALEYILPLRHLFMVTCMLVHVSVIQLAYTFYDGLFQCNQNDNMTKENLTIWKQTIKKVKIRSRISIIWGEYMNENKKIFELWMKHVSIWPNLAHKIKLYTLVNRYNTQ